MRTKFQVGDRVRVRRNKKAVGTVDHVIAPEGERFPLYKVRFGLRTCRFYECHEIEPAPKEDAKP